MRREMLSSVAFFSALLYRLWLSAQNLDMTSYNAMHFINTQTAGVGSSSTLMHANQSTSIPFETRVRRGLSFADVNVRGMLVHEDWQPFRNDVTPRRHIDVLLKWPTNSDGINCKINIIASTTLAELALALITELRRYYASPRYNYAFPKASHAVNNAVLISLNQDRNGLWVPELELP
ncbi:hypothetical protein AX14_013665 [Amanita brunnescens Koide BX004]|nr:hypothetical protein AX14_013665 [Amanita brunnescens Koide BX004]